MNQIHLASRRAMLLAVGAALVGCGDNQQRSQLDAAQVDAPVGELCTTLELAQARMQYNGIGQLTGLRFPIKSTGYAGQLLLMELYDESTGGLPKLTAGTFDLATAPNNNLATCQHCVYIASEAPGPEGFPVTTPRFFQTKGSLALTKVADPFDNLFAGTFSAEMAEVTVDKDNNVTVVPGGRCAKVQLAFDTTPTRARCETLVDCPNEELQVCDPAMQFCVAPQCDIENGGCPSNQACVPQIENLFQGACYDICNPQRSNDCGPNRTCKQTGPSPSFGLCLLSSDGQLGETCEVKNASTSCSPGLVCSAASETCTASCDFFALAPATPGCSSDTRCSLLGRCEPFSAGDPAQLGQPCLPEATLAQGCAADDKAFQGYCFGFREQDPLVCIEACLGDEDCRPEQFCAQRFSSGLGTCLPDPVCGDGVLGEVGEVCDDGNTMQGDTCSSDCQTVNYPASCARAQNINPGVTAGNTTTALDGFFATCQGGLARTQLYRYDPPGPGRLTVTIDSPSDHIAWLRSSCVDDGSELGCEFLRNNSGRKLVTQLTNGNILTLGVGAFNVVEQGPFNVNVEFVPEMCGDGIVAGREVCDDSNTMSNDGCSSNCRTIEYNVYCAEAAPLSTTNANVGDTTNAPFIFDNDCSATVTGRDRLYTFTAPRAGTLTLSLEQGEIDLALAVFRGCGAPATMEQLACSSVLGPNEEATVELTAGEKITIVVDGFSDRSAGPYSLAAQFQ